MNIYTTHQRLMAKLLLVSLLLQSCLHNQENILPTKKAPGPSIPISSNRPTRIDSHTYTAAKGEQVKLKQTPEGYLASVRDYPGANKYQAAVYIEPGMDIRELSNISTYLQKKRIHVTPLNSYEKREVVITKALGVGGMMEGEEEEEDGKKDENEKIKQAGESQEADAEEETRTRKKRRIEKKEEGKKDKEKEKGEPEEEEEEDREGVSLLVQKEKAFNMKEKMDTV